MVNFMNFVTFNVKPFLKYENKWCETMNYFNPYLDPFENRLSSKMSYSKKSGINVRKIRRIKL